jgi:hypothetical protein
MTRDEIRNKYPSLAKKAASGRRLAAIRLFCIECMGGNAADARTCETSVCPLWNCRGRSGNWSGSPK